MKTHGSLRYYPPLAAAGARPRGGGTWRVACAPYLTIKVKRLFPRANPHRDGAILIASTPEVCRDLEWLLERWPLELDDSSAEALKGGADEHRSIERTVTEILAGNRPPLPMPTPAREPRPSQLAAADLARATRGLLLTDVLGLGKSMSAILAVADPEFLPALVVCPTHLPRQWVGEFRQTFPLLRCRIITRGTPYDLTDVLGDPDVLIMSYSKLRGWGNHLAGLVRGVVFDEVQELRRGDSQKYTAAAHIADAAELRLGLTATPVFNYGDEIHTIMEVLAPGRLGDRQEFLREWGGRADVGMGQHATVADPAALGLYLRSEGLMLRRTWADVPGEAPPEPQRIAYPIDSDADVFDELAEEAIGFAELIVTRQASKQELWRAHGEFDWRMRQATGIAKAPFVAEFVKLLLESDEQVVLWGWHRAVYDIWLERLKAYNPTLYTGTESPTQKNRAQDAFMGGDARVLLMSLRSGAGLDGLQEVCHIGVFGELDWAPAMHDQCLGRLARGGQTKPVLGYFLISDHGADPKMAEVLELKRQQAEPILDPDRPLFTPVADPRERIRELARDVVARRRREGAA